MHELAVTESILDIAIKHAQKANARQVTHLHLVIGIAQLAGNDCFHLIFESMWVLFESPAERHHRISIRDAVGDIAVLHDEVPVIGSLADEFDQPGALFERIGIGMHKNGAVLVALGGGNVQFSHVTTMELSFPLIHLQPLVVIAMQRVDLAECFHRQIEDQFEMGDATGERPPFQAGNKKLTRGL